MPTAWRAPHPTPHDLKATGSQTEDITAFIEAPNQEPYLSENHLVISTSMC